jgi:hypothetical protein
MATKAAAMPVAPMPDDGSADDAMPPDVDAAAPADAGSQSIVTICKDADGTYMVYAGDEPESGAAAEPSAPGEEAAVPEGESEQGIPCDSIGKALKAALDILQADENEGEGSAEDNFNAGFSGAAMPSPKRPAPAMKY